MLGPRKPLGGQYVGAGGALVTPEQVAQQKQIAAALLEQAGDTSPVGHWSAALNRGLQGWLGGRDMYRARQSESEGTSKALERFNSRNSGAGAASRVAEALAGGVASGQPYTPPAEAAAIREGLIARGLPEHIADGFIMNFQDESGLNPGINERNPIVPGSRGGFGLYQLTGPRRVAYEQFAAERGVDPADVDAQLDFLMYELQGPEAKAAQSIFSAQNAGEAGAAIVNQFLRPASEHRTSRANRYLGAGAGISAGPAASNVSEIAALLADPWLPKGAKDVLQAEMNQQMQMQNAAYEMQLQQQDPMRQLEMQRAQLELDKLRNPGRPKPIEVGGVLLDAETLTPVFDSREAPRPTGNIQEYEYYADRALERGEEPMPFERYQASIARAGSGAASGVGTIPAGYQAITDPLTGQITGLQPIPGGPAELDAEKNAEALKSRETNKANSAAIVAQNIDKAIDQTSGWTAGVGGSILGRIPGSGATDLRSTIDTIRANIGFDRLQQMRDSSPTGGALGGIAIQELQMLQAVLGSLDQSQSPEQLKENLQRLKAIYEPIAAKAAAYPNAKDFGFDGASGEDQEKPKTRRRYNPQTRSFE